MSEEERLFIGKIIGSSVVSMLITADFVSVVAYSGEAKLFKNYSKEFLAELLTRLR